MKLITFAKNFAKDESGAVTVDWVVLTAGIVGLGIAIMASVGQSTADLGDLISGELTSDLINTY